MRFRLIPKSTTLDDPKLTLNGYYALCCITHVFSDTEIDDLEYLFRARQLMSWHFWLSDKTVRKFAQLPIYCQ